MLCQQWCTVVKLTAFKRCDTCPMNTSVLKLASIPKWQKALNSMQADCLLSMHCHYVIKKPMDRKLPKFRTIF